MTVFRLVAGVVTRVGQSRAAGGRSGSEERGAKGGHLGGEGGTEGQGGSLGGRMIWYRRIATGTLVTNGPPDLYGSH